MRLLCRSDSDTVVATGIALHLALRTAQKRNPTVCIPLTSVVAGNKTGLVLSPNPARAVVATGIALHLALRTAEKSNPKLFISLTSVVASNKAGLVLSPNPVQAVVAAGVALNLALRTAQKCNPSLFISLTSVVAGDKAGLLLRSNPVIAVVATGVATHLTLRTAQKHNPKVSEFSSQVLSRATRRDSPLSIEYQSPVVAEISQWLHLTGSIFTNRYSPVLSITYEFWRTRFLPSAFVHLLLTPTSLSAIIQLTDYSV
jgi:hypothetical protein